MNIPDGKSGYVQKHHGVNGDALLGDLKLISVAE